MSGNQPYLLRSTFDGADLRSDKAKPAGNIFYISKGFNAV